MLMNCYLWVVYIHDHLFIQSIFMDLFDGVVYSCGSLSM